MTNAEMNCGKLSDRLMLMRNEFASVKRGHYDWTPQRASFFLAMLDESVEDALLLEGSLFVKAEKNALAQSSSVVVFPKPHARPHLIGKDRAE